MEHLVGREDKTLKYLQLAIDHGLIPAPERWYGKSEPGVAPLLPAGMQIMGLGELYRVAVRQFKDSRQRRRLWTAIERFYAKLAQLHVASELWLAGSFLSNKAEPADVDAAIVLAAERVVMLSPNTAFVLDELLDDAKRSKLDVALIFEGDLAVRAYVQGLLGFREDRRMARGIAVVQLPNA